MFYEKTKRRALGVRGERRIGKSPIHHGSSYQNNTRKKMADGIQFCVFAFNHSNTGRKICSTNQSDIDALTEEPLNIETTATSVKSLLIKPT
jgi:hypothetical protein